MSKSFREWNVDQVWLLPPSINDFVPADHVAHFVRDTVRTALHLGLILRSYRSERGQPPFHPAMMVALLLYAYSLLTGAGSQRRSASQVFDLESTAGMASRRFTPWMRISEPDP